MAGFEAKIPLFIYELNCNPYVDATCTTTPPQTQITNTNAVCSFVYTSSTKDKDGGCLSYDVQTFESRQAASAAGAILTHEGSCGLCSTAQDLAVYLTQDFTTAGKICATKGLLEGEEEGQKCYEDIGLTQECAKIWNYDGIFDGQACGRTCADDLTSPNNGPPPLCTISDCLECDEEKAGPLFSQFAGRTRRRSGLLSEIIRNCDDIAKAIDHDPSKC